MQEYKQKPPAFEGTNAEAGPAAGVPVSETAGFTAASRFTTRSLALSGIIAALYAGLTLALPVPAYGGIQFRAAEAMTVLPWLFPEAIPGLAVGCFLVNLLSPFALDCVFGTLATLFAALWTARVQHRWAAPIPPVVCNAVIVGAEIAWYAAADGEKFLTAWAVNGLTVGLGEAAACGILGLLLLQVLDDVLPGVQLRLEARKMARMAESRD